MTNVPRITVKCPTCPGRFELEELIPLVAIQCPECGNEWQISLQDVPGGRPLVDLTRPAPPPASGV